jgi:hypothetical protein
LSQSYKHRFLAGPALLWLAAATALALGTAAPAVAAGQAPNGKPKVSFSFKTNKITAGTRPVIKYTASGLPSGSKLELQRQFGTSHVWKDVTALRGHSGTASVAKVQMGQYQYRIKIGHKGKTVVISRSKVLFAYGRVPLTNICNDQNHNSKISMSDDDGCQTQTVQVNGTIFVYLISDFPQAPPNFDQDITFGTNTSCRTITLNFSMDNNAQSTDTAHVQVVQTAADPQSKSVGAGQIGNAFFKLDGGPWDLNLSATSDEEYVNGYLSCYSAGGIR